jgi:hypothetical protein
VNRGYAMPSVRAPPALEGVLVYLGGVDDLLDDLRRTDEKLSGGDVDRVLEYAAKYVIGIPAPTLVLYPLYHRPRCHAAQGLSQAARATAVAPARRRAPRATGSVALPVRHLPVLQVTKLTPFFSSSFTCPLTTHPPTLRSVASLLF